MNIYFKNDKGEWYELKNGTEILLHLDMSGGRELKSDRIKEINEEIRQMITNYGVQYTGNNQFEFEYRAKNN